MMFKRNEGYALSYVLVVLLVLCIIAISVMSAPLRNLQMQQASIARMQDKYAAQGMIEQVVAQLEHAESTLTPEQICLLGTEPQSIVHNMENSSYIIDGKSGDCVVTAEIQLSEKMIPVTPGEGNESEQSDESEGSEDSEEPEIITQFAGYSVKFISYNISYNAGGGA